LGGGGGQAVEEVGNREGKELSGAIEGRREWGLGRREP